MATLNLHEAGHACSACLRRSWLGTSVIDVSEMYQRHLVGPEGFEPPT